MNSSMLKPHFLSTYKPDDIEREAFRKYLEREGVMDVLTKILLTLYEEKEKPKYPLKYIKEQLQELVEKLE
ncbi:unnamed protein product [Gordionus sp. m RMFG-2023]